MFVIVEIEAKANNEYMKVYRKIIMESTTCLWTKLKIYVKMKDLPCS